MELETPPDIYNSKSNYSIQKAIYKLAIDKPDNSEQWVNIL